MKKSLRRAVADYKKAERVFKEAEKALNPLASERIRACKNNRDKLSNLAQYLPAGYEGTRRVYEAILRLDKN